MKIYANARSEDFICKNEETEFDNFTKNVKTFNNFTNFDDATKENIKEHNRIWSQSPDHPCRILITGSSGLGKTNALVINLILIKFIYTLKLRQNINC